MTRFKTPRAGLIAASALSAAALAGGVLIGLATTPAGAPAGPTAESRKVLYWYDPMVPG